MNIEVIRAGWLTTIQDAGRKGLMCDGITRGGALDGFAWRVANLLVGNAETCAAFEITLGGFVVKFDDDSLIAIGGGDLEAKIGDKHVPRWRRIYIKRESVLSFGRAQLGARAYLAVGGGLSVEKIFGSRSAMLQIESDDLPLRPVRAGDVIKTDAMNACLREACSSEIVSSGKGIRAAKWSISSTLFPAYSEYSTVRVIRGGEYQNFTPASRASLTTESFRVCSNSNRTGYRLEGAPLKLNAPREMLSEVVMPGTIQIPPDGAPIILLADCQTHGGYPRIAHVATVDLPVIAQTKSGASVRFIEISLAEAQRLNFQRERDLSLLKHAISFRSD
ncbi:MAG: biotin-dependent carboxyltransferase family protein [Pyrinomonadaceae bacterium MAG19_C2-C3]|nr:biotin-dependent carboxyltransferase family protein [Pyrinomonadaceae bacterium MAG19_C2-C3]